MKNVLIKRQMTLKIKSPVDGEQKTYKHKDPAVISDEFYEKHSDWFDLIEDVPDGEDDYEGYTVEELRDMLRDSDKKVSGNKSDLIERLREEE